MKKIHLRKERASDKGRDENKSRSSGENPLKQISKKINDIEDKQERREKLDTARVFRGPLLYKKDLVYEILRRERERRRYVGRIRCSSRLD